tara:strand:+ start:2262 stop:2831 length:570 start_codon:yes stop_codon:yes gene_type:complete
MWGAIAGAGISLLGNMLAKKPKTKTVSNEQLAVPYTDFKNTLDKRVGFADSLMDPNSSLNQIRIQNLKKNSFENMAFQNMLNNRNMAQGGIGGYSGIAGAQQSAGVDRVQQQNQDRIQTMIANNFNLGLKELGGVGQGQQQYGNIMGQNLLNNTAMQNQIAQARAQSDVQGFMGLGQGILNYALNNPTG